MVVMWRTASGAVVAPPIHFKRMKRFAKVLILPLAACFALDRTAPLEGAATRLGDEDAPRVVSAAAAQQVAAIDVGRRLVAHPTGRSQRSA